MTAKNIGFLFNHDGVHQVAHIAPIILGLRQGYPHINIVVLASSEAQLERLFEITGPPDEAGFNVKQLEIPGYLRLFFRGLNKIGPVQRLYILKRYKPLFESLDCLVVPEFTSARLKTHLGLTITPLILFPHGAGDRAIGFGKEIADFDYVLLSGSKVRDRMLESGLITTGNHCLVGYPKFDTIEPAQQGKNIYFSNTNPIILYNPHFDARLSSWYKMGLDVLEFFSRRQDYNLIVAPHVMLYKKKIHISPESRQFSFTKKIPSKYRKCANIRIDLGSKSSVNMDYTLSADVYLGDVSSQVYEFLYRPRPCIFLNSHQADWSDNPDYRHWQCGPVLDKVADLETVLSDIEAAGKRFRDTQIKLFAETFDLNSTASSLRAAQAIVSFLDTRTPTASRH